MDTNDLFERGMQIRRDMYGPSRADDELAAATSFNRPLQEMITTWCFGDVWSRPGLSRRDRSLITVAQMAALGKQGALTAHVEGALANGVTKDEIMEIILNTAIYCGIPTAGDATKTAMDVLKKKGME